MFASRTIAVLSVLSMTGCSFLAKGKAGLGGSSSSSPSSSGPSSSIPSSNLKADNDDPPHVTTALNRLEEMAKMIEARDFTKYARESRDFQGTFLLRDGWAGEKKHDAMQKRLGELDAAAFKAFGGRVFAAVGDGKRVLKADPDAIEAAGEMLAACERAAKTQTTGTGEAATELANAIATYDKAIARAKKFDPQVFRYMGEAKDGFSTMDVPTQMMACEVELAASATQFEDEYKPEVADKVETEKGCGSIDWLADGVQVGGGKFAPYTRTQGGATYPERIACNKFPKRSTYGKDLASSVKDFAGYVGLAVSDLVVVTRDKAYVEEDNDDLRLHRYQKLTAYSKSFQFAKNPCGDAKMFCEAGGSKGAAAFNRMEHAFDRAAVHAGKDPELCKQHLKAAKAQADWFAEFHTSAVKSGDWIGGATYKTKKGAKLKEKEFVAAFADKGKQADDMLLAKYCASPAKPGK